MPLGQSSLSFQINNDCWPWPTAPSTATQRKQRQWQTFPCNLFYTGVCNRSYNCVIQLHHTYTSPHSLLSKPKSRWGEALTGVRVKSQGGNITLEIPSKEVSVVCLWGHLHWPAISHGLRCFECFSPSPGSLAQLFSRQLLRAAPGPPAGKA